MTALMGSTRALKEIGSLRPTPSPSMSSPDSHLWMYFIMKVAFRDIMDERLHPCVGLRTPGEEVVANFGGQPFVADFDSVLASYKGQASAAFPPHRTLALPLWPFHHMLLTSQVTSSVASTSLPLLSSQGTPLIPQLLYDHLMHHRCPETAAIIARDMLSVSQVWGVGDGGRSPEGTCTPQVLRFGRVRLESDLVVLILSGVKPRSCRPHKLQPKERV